MLALDHTGARRARLLLCGALAVMLAAMVPVPALAGLPDVCKVRNTRTAVTVGRLQKAVNQARVGDRLEVRGTCVGATTVGKDLVIVGVQTVSLGEPGLSGNNVARPLRIGTDATVTLVDITVRDGFVPAGVYPANSGAGVLVRGHLTLKNAFVRHNEVSDAEAGGGGIEVMSGATLIVRGSSRIRRNVGGWGGGIDSNGTTVLRDTARVDHNTALSGGGGVFVDSALPGEVFRMRHNARIDHNEAPEGGGVYLFGPMVMLGDARIDANTATEEGGGIFWKSGDLDGASCGDNIVDNSPDQIAPACP